MDQWVTENSAEYTADQPLFKVHAQFYPEFFSPCSNIKQQWFKANLPQKSAINALNESFKAPLIHQSCIAQEKWLFRDIFSASSQVEDSCEQTW